MTHFIEATISWLIIIGLTLVAGLGLMFATCLYLATKWWVWLAVIALVLIRHL